MEPAPVSELLPPASARRKMRLGKARQDDTLTSVVVGAFIIAALSLGHQIFVPIAIAVLLSFVLAPSVLRLRAWGAPRTLAVLLVVFVTFSFILGLGTILGRQLSDLASDLPRYQATISQKIEAVRETARGSTFIDRAAQIVASISNPLTRRKAGPGAAPTNPSDSGASEPAPEPVPVEVHQPAPGAMDMLRTIASTVLEPLATAGIVAIFIVFILMQREDLRDRMIRLIGGGDLHRTTIALDDAASRLSRFFLVQTALNAGFGLVIGIGLSLIGVPSPVLWGLLAMIMRFVPYVGAFVAALGPVALAAAVDPGWSMALLTIALFVILEPITGQIIEPLLYGHSTGLSPIAVVIAATFWTWLWGPVGLVLSTPLTVCLVVLGRHVERLSFLDVILSDAPALTPPESFYQRMLAGDPAEAADQARDYLRTHPLLALYEDIVLQGLLMAQADLRRGLLETQQQTAIRDTIGDVIDDLEDAGLEARESEAIAKADEATRRAASLPPAPIKTLPRLLPEQTAPGFAGENPVLCIAGRSPLDEAAAAILVQMLTKHGIGAKVEGAEMLAPGRLSRLPSEGVKIVCLSYLDADLAASHVRYGVRRIKRRVPGAQLVGCFWMPEDVRERAGEICKSAGADHCAATLTQALEICIEAARLREGQSPTAQEAVA